MCTCNNLFIVESPNKAHTIQKILGKKFFVVSSFGHIVNLPSNKLGIDIKNGFIPNYIIPDNKKNIVYKIKKLIKKYKIIWLATDEDREGESISWHLYKQLKIPKKKIRRITFNEITKKSIKLAIKNPRKINKDLVKAQQTRRILDRIVGFELSPILWYKIKSGLSAGRVQSIAVRLIMDKEKKIKNFIPKLYYKINGFFLKNKKIIKSYLNKNFYKEKDVNNFFNFCKKKNIFFIDIIKKKIKNKSPLAPFNTSSLQQESYNKLKYSVYKTMNIAQKLYEKGYITYIRTDSVLLSKEAINKIKEKIIFLYGKEYFKYRKYINKSKFIQEAHEAIRPTNINNLFIDIEDKYEKNLYKLIWDRTISSQMKDAKIEENIIHIKNKEIIENKKKEYDKILTHFFIHKSEKIIFDGFLKVNNKHINSNYNISFKKKEEILIKKIIAENKNTEHPARYTESSLIKNLEKLGIGRPSTYVPILYNIQKRNYVINKSINNNENEKKINILLKKNKIYKKEILEKKINKKNKKFLPTKIGIIVNDFLIKYFPNILDYKFTAKIEKYLDEIASGKKKWNNIIKKFYKKFNKNIKNVKKNIKKIKIKNEKFIGIDPISGKKIFSKIGRFGPFIQLGEGKNKEKPRFIPIFDENFLEKISLKEAIKLFSLPINLGFYKKKNIVLNTGKYGLYIQYDKKNIHISNDLNFFFKKKITLKKTIKFIKDYNKKNKIFKKFKFKNKLINIYKGKYGFYINYNKKNYKIPKNIDLNNINLKICKEIIK